MELASSECENCTRRAAAPQLWGPAAGATAVDFSPAVLADAETEHHRSPRPGQCGALWVPLRPLSEDLPPEIRHGDSRGFTGTKTGKKTSHPIQNPLPEPRAPCVPRGLNSVWIPSRDTCGGLSVAFPWGNRLTPCLCGSATSGLQPAAYIWSSIAAPDVFPSPFRSPRHTPSSPFLNGSSTDFLDAHLGFKQPSYLSALLHQP